MHGNMESIHFLERMLKGILDSKRKIAPTSRLDNKFPTSTFSCTVKTVNQFKLYIFAFSHYLKPKQLPFSYIISIHQNIMKQAWQTKLENVTYSLLIK